ncbi:MAG: hypothetical protein ABR524_10025 [Thermoanaerobaculia bacterium]
MSATRVRKAKADPATTKPKPVKAVRERKVAVTERILQHAAVRLISTPLVSVEISYLQKHLGNTETETNINEAVASVRRLPWATVAMGA